VAADKTPYLDKIMLKVQEKKNKTILFSKIFSKIHVQTEGIVKNDT